MAGWCADEVEANVSRQGDLTCRARAWRWRSVGLRLLARFFPLRAIRANELPNQPILL